MNLRLILKDIASERTQGLVPTSAPTRYQLILLHTLVTIVLCYQLLFSKTPLVAPFLLDLIAVGLLATIVGLVTVPIRLIASTWSVATLALADTGLTTLCVYLSGNASSNLYITYFLIMLIAAFAPTLKQMIGLSVTLCLVYGGVLFLETDRSGELYGNHLLQIPILLLLAIFYGVTNETTRMLSRDKTALLDSMSEQHRAEQALRESEQRIRLVLEHALDAFVMLDANGCITEWNVQAETLFGWTRKEVLGRRLSDTIIPLQHRAAHEAGLRRFCATDQGPVLNTRNEVEAIHRQGHVFPIELSVSPLKKNGVMVFTAFIRDITARRHSEEALRKSNERFELMARATNDAVWDWDLTTNALWWNESFLSLFGYTPEQIEPGVESWSSRVHPEDHERIVGGVHAVIDRGMQHWSDEYRFRRADSSYAYVLDRGQVIRDGAGKPIRMIGAMTDITDRKQAEQDVRDSEERYRRLVEVSPDAIFVAKQNRIVFINRTGMALLGATTSEQIIGRSAFDFLHPEHDPATNQRIRYALERGMPIPLLEYKMLRLDGTMIDVELVGSPLADPGSATIQVIARNITERRQLEEQLRQSQKMDAVGQLAGGVAHDFNNMLLIIGGFSDLLMNDPSLTDDQRQSAEQIGQASKRAGGLTRQLLAFSRRQVLQPKVVKLDTLLGNLDHMIRTLAGESIEYLFVSDPLLGYVKADPGQIEQALINLVVNARDAMPHGGRLTLTTDNVDLDEETIRRNQLDARPGPHIRLVVSDTGVGMDADTLARIYEPFFTTKPKGKGTGLGLSTVYGIVKQSGGCLHVTSSLGQGTTFSLYLARVEDVIDPQGDEGDQGKALSGTETILVAEDEPGVRTLVSHALRQHGYTVLEARHGVEALVICERHTKPIHLLLTDVVMPQLNGRELAERLVAKLPELLVLYMSGYTDDAVLRRGLIAADTNFLHKPFTTGALANRVRQLLNVRQPSGASLTN